jgi:ribosomal protein S8E
MGEKKRAAFDRRSRRRRLTGRQPQVQRVCMCRPIPPYEALYRGVPRSRLHQEKIVGQSKNAGEVRSSTAQLQNDQQIPKMVVTVSPA